MGISRLGGVSKNNQTTNMELLEYAIPPPHDKKPGCRFPQGATAFTKFCLRCFTGDDNYDDFCTHFAFLSRKSWFCAVSWRKWHICALNGLRILMKENPSNLGHCSLTNLSLEVSFLEPRIPPAVGICQGHTLQWLSRRRLLCRWTPPLGSGRLGLLHRTCFLLYNVREKPNIWKYFTVLSHSLSNKN